MKLDLKLATLELLSVVFDGPVLRMGRLMELDTARLDEARRVLTRNMDLSPGSRTLRLNALKEVESELSRRGALPDDGVVASLAQPEALVDALVAAPASDEPG